MLERDVSEVQNPFWQKITSAYDLSSGGMGIHLASVRFLAAGQPLTNRYRESLEHYDCNYLVNPYVDKWKNTNSKWENGPKFQSSHTKRHLKLLFETDAEYRRLQWQIMRHLLRGEEIDIEHASKPISNKELPYYLRTAVRNGLIVADNEIVSAIKPGSSPGKILINLS